MNGRAAAGFTLIEVLIAMVLLSIGLMGVVALQMESMRSTQNAQLRARAVVLAADVAERMRSNRVGALAGNYLTNGGGDGANRDCTDDLDGGATVICSPLQLAEHDLWQWQQNLESPQTGLPGNVVGSIVSDGAAVPAFTIEIAWQEKDDAFSYSLVLQL